MNVIYEDNHLLVVEKPVNIPVQADNSQDPDLLTILKDYLKEKYQKPGNVYLGLVHRLDRPVGGVMVFAKTSKAASRLSEQVRKNEINKTYTAVVCHKMEKEEDRFLDYMVKDSKTNTSKVVSKNAKDAKEARLNYRLLDYKNDLSLVEIYLETGRSHQIRVQFSSRNHPLWGDQRYNKNAKVGQQIALFASRLEFIHPTTKEKMVFQLVLPNTAPFNQFQ